MKLFNRKVLTSALASGLTVAAIGFAGSANADPITYMTANTNVEFKYTNDEMLITQTGQVLSGVFDVSSICTVADSCATNLWVGNGTTDNTQLVGFFYGLTATVSVTGAVTFTGGHMVIYDVPNGDWKPGANPNVDPSSSLTVLEQDLCGGIACPAPWATLDFVPGILDPTNTTTTLNAVLAPTSPATATGDGYLSVATNATYGTGTNNHTFDSNAYLFTNPLNLPADAFLLSDFSACPSSTTPACDSTGWHVDSHDPVYLRTVPEPGTLALLGLGLLGAGMVRRKKVA